MTASVVISLVVCGVTALMVAPRDVRARSWQIVRSLRPKHFAANLPVIGLVWVAIAVLWQVPFLRWSWWRAVSGRDGNVMVSGFQLPWLLPVMVVLFAVAIPVLAETEEWLFRRGTRGWWPSGVTRSVLFGLFHLGAGVPIFAALALTIPGLWFTRQYMRGGLERATIYHAAWNYQLIATGVVLTVWRMLS